MIALSVPDMSCDHCKATVEAAVVRLDPKASVTVDLDAQRVSVQTSAAPEDLIAALDAAGYQAALL